MAELSGLRETFVRVKETDLHILSECDVTKPAGELTLTFRLQVEHYIEAFPEFALSRAPLSDDKLAVPIIRDMIAAGRNADVGPMAAVAGAISEYVGKGLIDRGCKEIIIENGGDIFLQRSRDCTIAVFAGDSPLSNRVGLQISSSRMPLGICTSSGTVGHSMSLGSADSVTVLAASAVMADAAATRLGNEVGTGNNKKDGINRALDVAGRLPDIRGALVICGEVMGAVGEVELVPLD
ncbi:MAG: UPF0280 family protein [Desulfobacterales bacterium]|nr:UPF0280 family protein [Deltaproteobacteria bacterium]NNK94307.1 UPF0280 family protein [Desulfobacterales bacterium]